MRVVYCVGEAAVPYGGMGSDLISFKSGQDTTFASSNSDNLRSEVVTAHLSVFERIKDSS